MFRKSLPVTTAIIVLSFILASCNPAATPPPALPSSSAASSATSSTTPTSNTAAASAAPTVSGLLAQQQAFIDIYAHVNPSVVTIRVVETAAASAAQTPNQPNLPNLPQGQTPPSQAEGSGFIYDTLGHIVTNNHVIAGATRIIVTFSDGSEAEAKLVGADPDSDLAVIQVKVDASKLVVAEIGNSDALKVGQIVVAIGNPFAQQGSMSTGIVSGLGRMISSSRTTTSIGGNYSIPNVIQTDAAINPGNSGGPLLDLNGQIIGVNTAIDSPVGANSGVGYAVPASLVKLVVPQLIKSGKVEHAFLGIAGVALNSDLATAMKLDPNQRGILVNTVTSGGPADKAGLKASAQNVTIDGIDYTVGGDVITAINGQQVFLFDDLLGYIIGRTRPGDVVTLTILRDGKSMEVKVTLAPRPAA